MKKCRYLFTDEWNSFSHVCFGVCSILFPVIIPNFILYQLIDIKDVNLLKQELHEIKALLKEMVKK